MLIIGAGPAGLFAAFQLGLFRIESLLIDAADRPGGQLSAFYEDKPIFDAPGFPSILAGELVEHLKEQAGLKLDQMILGVRVDTIAPTQGPGRFLSTLADGRTVQSQAVVLATGGGILGTGPVIDGIDTSQPLEVETNSFETVQQGLFAIGDGALYGGKLSLILSAFHEAALMTQAIRRLIGPREQASPRRSGRVRGKQPR